MLTWCIIAYSKLSCLSPHVFCLTDSASLCVCHKKYVTDPKFLDSYFLTSWYMRIFYHSEIYFEAACSHGIHWIDCVNCLIISAIYGYKKSNGSIFSTKPHPSRILLSLHLRAMMSCL